MHWGTESREKTEEQDRTQLEKVWLCHSEEAGTWSYKLGIPSQVLNHRSDLHLNVCRFCFTNMFYFWLPLGKSKIRHLEYGMTFSERTKALERWLITVVCSQPEKWIPFISLSWVFSWKGMECVFCNAFCNLTQFAHFFSGLCPFYINVSFTKKTQWQIIFTCPPIRGDTGDPYSTFCSRKWNKEAMKQHMGRMLQKIYNADKTYRFSRNQIM